jgi:hypothetical protein
VDRRNERARSVSDLVEILVALKFEVDLEFADYGEDD